WMSGLTPFGYRLNLYTRRLEVIEEEAQVVRLIFALYVHGLEEDGISKDVSFRAIASYLTRMGVPTPGGAKSWHYMTVRRIIQNEVYIGTVKYRTSRRVDNKYYPRARDEWIVVANAHEPIVDPETWLLAQQKFRHGRNIPNVKLDFSPCELAGLVVCAKCGRRMVRQCSVQSYRKKNGEISKYHKEFLWCPTPGCTTVKYRDVEAAILEYLKTLGSFNVQRLKEIFGEVCSRQREAAATIDTGELVEKKRAELKRRLKFICEKYEAGIYDDDTFLERKSEIDRELSMLESIRSRKNPEPEPEREIPVLRENINTFLAAYEAPENKSLKNKLLRELISAVYLDKTGKGKFDLSIYPRFAFNSGPTPQK
ncbi:recombinase family protein, partial [Desulfofundulus sp.]|uniref:recombinase family protein n=1 Tax=Desulfofundulus sp. TaxID=2282750 RepID=UPI003C730659